MPAPKPWTLEAAEQLYNLEGWGLKYFGINAKGNVTLQPKREPESAIDILDVVDDVASRGIKMPVLIRFQDVLRRHGTGMVSRTEGKTPAARNAETTHGD